MRREEGPADVDAEPSRLTESRGKRDGDVDPKEEDEMLRRLKRTLVVCMTIGFVVVPSAAHALPDIFWWLWR